VLKLRLSTIPFHHPDIVSKAVHVLDLSLNKSILTQ
jgi:hypothetical protein